MGEIVVLSSDDGEMETTMKMNNRLRSSEIVRWEKYLPKTVLRVLLVESDDSTRHIITALLRKCCYKVVAVSDGLAAWEILKEKTHNIDLILTELDLPSISGFALLALVMEHEACKNIPVIMMSSQDSITMVLKCMLRGAADYLIKPMRKNELKNLWQHVWRRLAVSNDDDVNNPHAQSLPASQHNNLDDDSVDSRCHSDQGSGAQVMSYNGESKLKEDVTMDLIGGIDKQSEFFYGKNSRGDEYLSPELGLSLKRSFSGSFENREDEEAKLQKLSLSDASAFSRYENGKPVEKSVIVVVEASSSGEREPKTPTESHEKLRKVGSDQGSATTSNIGSSSISGQQNQLLQQSSGKQQQQQRSQDSSLFPVESNRSKASKEVEFGSQSTCNSTEKPKEEEEESLTVQERLSLREAALMKFRLKRKDRCFDKKVRYQSRKKLAEQRPRVKGQFVRAVMNNDNSDASTKA